MKKMWLERGGEGGVKKHSGFKGGVTKTILKILQ